MTDRDSDTAPAPDSDAAPTPGDAQRVPVPNEHAAPGTSEETAAVDGIREHPVDPEPEDHNRGGKSF